MARADSDASFAVRSLPQALRFHAGPLALFLVLALWVTFPLWLAPAGRLESLGDPQLNSYLIHWSGWAFQHQLFGFFDANMFWPVESALAFGEHLITQALLVLPLSLAGAPASLLHNTSLFQAYLFSALAAYALGWFYFRSRMAALIVGLAYGFAPYRAVKSGHIQLVHGEFLPLMVLGLELALRGVPRGRLLLGLAAWAQWLTSWYWAVYTMWAFGPLLAWRLWRARVQLGLRGAALRAVLPLALALLAAAPAVLPYIELAGRNAYVRPEESTRAWSARVEDFVTPGARSLLYGGLGEGLRQAGDHERFLWAGVVPWIGVMGTAWLLLRGLRRRGTKLGLASSTDPDSPLSRGFAPGIWLGSTLLMFSFSFGLHYEGQGPAYGMPMPMALLREVTPMGSQMRAAARWMLPALLGLALLAAWVWTRLPEKGWKLATAVRVGLPLLLLAESLTRPMGWAAVESTRPAVYAWLEEQPVGTPVLLLPIEHERFVLDATWFSQPMVNGSNGYTPAGFNARMRLLATLPDPEAMDELRRLNVRYMIVDTTQGGATPQQWRAGFEQLGMPLREFGRYLVAEIVYENGWKRPVRE